MQTNPSRRAFLRMTGLGLASLGLAACSAPTGGASSSSSDAPSTERAEVVFWHPTQEHGELMQKSFNESGADFDVKFELGEYDSQTKTMAALAAGTPPPTSYNGRAYAPDLALGNAIYALDDRIDAATTFAWSDLWERLQKESVAWGKRWIVPYTTDTRALYYNKTLMAEAGLDPEVPPTTWAELQEMAIKMTKRDEANRMDVIGFTPTFGNPPVHLMFYTIVWCMGSDVVTEDLTQATVMDKGEEAMIFLKQLMESQGGYEEAGAFTRSLTLAEGIDAFSAGRVGLAMNTNGRLRNYDRYSPDLDYGLAVGPVFPEYNIEANYNGGGGWFFFKEGGNFDQAWQFVEFVMDPEFFVPYADEFWVMSSRSDVGAEWAKLDPRREIFIATANTVKWLPVYSGRSEASSTVPTMFDNIMLGGADIVSELEIVQAAFQESLDKHNSTTPPD